MTILEIPCLVVDDVVAISGISRPSLINRDPGPEEEDVPLGATIALEIIDPGPEGIDRLATSVWVDGSLAFDGNLLLGFNGPRSGVVQSADTLRIVLDPSVPFESQAQVTVQVITETNGGGHHLDETYYFTAEDKTAPKIIAAQAIGQKSVKLAFDEAVSVTDVQAFLFEALSAPAVPLLPVSAVSEEHIVTITLDTEMTPDIPYRVTVNGVQDASGNPNIPPDNTTVFQGFRPPRPLTRRFDLWTMLPKHDRRADSTEDLWRFISCLQEITDLLLVDVDRFSDILDLERAPEPFLDGILYDLGDPFPFDLALIDKRRLAAVLVEMYRQKGTAIGIKNAIRFFLGLEVEIVPFASDTLILGVSLLGVDWILGASSRFARYAFNVIVNEPISETQEHQLRAVVEYLKPAHTHFVDLITPSVPPSYDHWELGISELGLESDLH